MASLMIPLLLVVVTCAPRSAHVAATDLCSVLNEVDVGDERDVFVHGIYTEGPETHVLYSTECDGEFQSASWVELSAPAADIQRLRKVVDKFGQARITVRGTVYGPRRVVASEPVQEAAAVSQVRYGHLGLYRTMIVVREILTVEGVAARSTPPLIRPPRVARVIRAEMPTYPPALRAAGVTGEVRLEVEVRDGAAGTVRNISGHLLLAKAAADNVRTWVFESDFSGTLTVVFIYRLTGEEGGLRVEADLPNRVTIVDTPSRW